MKETYLLSIKEALNRYTNNFADIKDILKDYEEMYDDAISSGKSPAEVEAMLGDPNDIVDALKETLSVKRERRTRGNKIVAISPFLATMLFFITGFYLNSWQFGWMFFLMIPVLGILFNSPRRDRIVALSPFASLIAMMLIGFLTERWELAWLPFLSIPVLGYFTHGKRVDAIIFFILIVLGIGFYILYGETNGYQFSWLGFTPAILYAVIRGDITVSFGDLRGQDRRKAWLFVSFALSMVALFILIGYFYNAWGWSWQFVLLIPMMAIALFGKSNLVALMPFISLILFYSLGYFFGLFHISWIAFLLIPITAILTSKTN